MTQTINTIQKAYEDSQRVKDKDVFLSKLTNCIVVSTVEQDQDEAAWLKARTKGIGGSDIGTICGVNRYSSPRALYFKKTGQYEDAEFSTISDASKERMHFGHKLEPIVADEYIIREQKRVVICPATVAHKDYPWAIANVDRVIVDEDENPLGILEVKTADARMLKDWEEGEMPISYLYQLQWYLFVTGLEKGAIAALIGGNRFICYDVFRDDELINNVLLPAAEKFWNVNVKELIVPDVTDSEVDSQINKELYADAIPESEVMLEGDENDDLAELIVTTKAQIKELEKIKDEAVNKLQAKMGRHTKAVTNERIITWTPYTVRRVNADVLKQRYPDIYEECRTPSVARRFIVK